MARKQFQSAGNANSIAASKVKKETIWIQKRARLFQYWSKFCCKSKPDRSLYFLTPFVVLTSLFIYPFQSFLHIFQLIDRATFAFDALTAFCIQLIIILVSLFYPLIEPEELAVTYCVLTFGTIFTLVLAILTFMLSRRDDFQILTHRFLKKSSANGGVYYRHSFENKLALFSIWAGAVQICIALWSRVDSSHQWDIPRALFIFKFDPDWVGENGIDIAIWLSTALILFPLTVQTIGVIRDALKEFTRHDWEDFTIVRVITKLSVDLLVFPILYSFKTLFECDFHHTDCYHRRHWVYSGLSILFISTFLCLAFSFRIMSTQGEWDKFYGPKDDVRSMPLYQIFTLLCKVVFVEIQILPKSQDYNMVVLTISVLILLLDLLVITVATPFSINFVHQFKTLCNLMPLGFCALMYVQMNSEEHISFCAVLWLSLITLVACLVCCFYDHFEDAFEFEEPDGPATRKYTDPDLEFSAVTPARLPSVGRARAQTEDL